jgi:hypothetical protein
MTEDKVEYDPRKPAHTIYIVEVHGTALERALAAEYLQKTPHAVIVAEASTDIALALHKDMMAAIGAGMATSTGVKVN